MKRSGTKWPTSSFLFPRLSLASILLLSGADLPGFTGHYQVSPYFDSNVLERLGNPLSSGGFKIGGRLSHEVLGSRASGSGTLMAHLFLDGGIPEESKLAVNLDSGFRYFLSPLFYSVFNFAHFSKAFFLQTRRYGWSEGMAGFGVLPSRALRVQVNGLYRTTAFVPSEVFRFSDRMVEFELEYAVTDRISARAAAILGSVDYDDFEALALSRDSTLTGLGFDQVDESLKGLVHLHYGGKVVFGIQGALQFVNSNSVIGEFDLGAYRVYVSGRLGHLYFFHLVYQRVDKRYRYPRIQGLSGFRDPEERIQNRTYLQLERTASENRIFFLQLSILNNETIWNQQYYDKVLVELGFQSSF
ncbi:MAG: hypothetical protein ACE5HZ_06055 [Fidelibacterota bacterium]